MWDLVTRLLWLPLDIMQRISQRAFQLGRTVYGGLFGPAAKPAITPPPPPSTTCSKSSSSSALPSKRCSVPFPSSKSSPGVVPDKLEMESVPTCVVIEMEELSQVIPDDVEPKIIISPINPSTISNAQLPESLSLTSDVKATAVPNTFQDDIEIISKIPEAEASTIILPDKSCADNVVTCDGATGASVATVTQPLTCVFNKSLSSEEPAEVTIKSEARVVDDDATCNSTASTGSAETTAINKANKRFREREKRRQMETTQTQPSSTISSVNSTKNEIQLIEIAQRHSQLQAKKPKLSVEASENPSTSTFQAIQDKRKKKKRSKKKTNAQVSTGEGEGVKMKTPQLPPNFFIAIQILNKDIISKVAQLQKSLTEQVLSPPWHDLTNTEIFKDAMVPVAKLHFTLHVMHLNGEEDVQKAKNALTECCRKVHQEFVDNPMELTIQGVGHFKNNVIFAQIKEKSHITRLTKLSDLFREKFNQLDIPVDPRPFNPHMTIAKISRSNKLYKKKIRAFPPHIWSDCGEMNFGVQRVSGLQLLQMAGEDKATGYYQCFGQYYFEDPILTVDQEKTLDRNSDDQNKH